MPTPPPLPLRSARRLRPLPGRLAAAALAGLLLAPAAGPVAGATEGLADLAAAGAPAEPATHSEQALDTALDNALADSLADPLAGPLEGIGPFPAADHELSAFKWTRRVLAVFADTPDDPAYRRQLELVAERPGPLEERDVIVLTDSAPAEATPLRKALRPRGFAVVIVDKDGRVLQRRPSPWGVREITRLIDSTPLRRQQEMGGAAGD